MTSMRFVKGERWTEGTGSPEGVVAAPVGTRWTDTAATFGAVEWVKATGTGKTGWVVAVGDTGIVDVTAQCTIGGAAPISGDRVRAQRTPNHVTLWAALAERPSPPSPLVVKLPAWALPGLTRMVAVSVRGATPTNMLSTNSAGVVRLWGLPPSAPSYVDGAVFPLSPTVTPWRTS